MPEDRNYVGYGSVLVVVIRVPLGINVSGSPVTCVVGSESHGVLVSGMNNVTCTGLPCMQGACAPSEDIEYVLSVNFVTVVEAPVWDIPDLT